LLAITLTVALFTFWLVIGWAAVLTLHTRRNLLQGLLLAPSVGLALTLLPIFWLSRAGLPVASCSIALGVILLLLALAALWWNRPLASFHAYSTILRAYVPFACPLILALALIGRPMLEFNLDWVSYANDDMANYVLGGHHFASNGYFAPPDADTLTGGLDYSLTYWDFVITGSRLGSELLLAWVISVTGLTGHQIFMPVIVTMQLALISATGSLLYTSRRAKSAALMTCLLLALSALSALGVLYQLISQTGGLSLFVAATALLLRPPRSIRPAVAIRHGILAALVASGLLILYPEVVPFLILAFVVYVAITVARRQMGFLSWHIAITIGMAAVTSLILLNWQAISAMSFLVNQASGGTTAFRPDHGSLFPYYLVPSGLSNLWGFLPVASEPREPWLSVSIVLGAVLLVLTFGTSLALTWRLQPAAIVTLIMLILSVHLFRQRADFGLYKLAMYIQPFMLATLVLAWFGIAGRPLCRFAPLIALGLLSLPGQFAYVHASRGIGSGFNELHDASSTRLTSEFDAIVQQIAEHHNPEIMLDSSSITLAKFQSIYTRGITTQFVSRFFFWFAVPEKVDPMISHDLIDLTSNISAKLRQFEVPASFPWFSGVGVSDEMQSEAEGDPLSFTIHTVGQSPTNASECTHLVGMTGQQTFLNRWTARPNGYSNFFVLPCADVKNHLIFVESMLGHPYYANTSSKYISFYQLEPDISLGSETFAGIGRWMLLRVVNPSDQPRLMVNMTASLKSDDENQLPPAIVIGSERWPIPFVGRGSGRVFSAPITPVEIAGGVYVGVDMGVDGKEFPDRRPGLLSLYGNDIPLDRRLLTGFVRDISMVSREDFEQMSPPRSVQAFPADFMNRDLEYSGVYEDGWNSEASFFTLTQPAGGSTIVARGEVPLIDGPDFATELHLLVDGEEVARRVLRPGPFDIRGPVAFGGGRRRVDLRFSELQLLEGSGEQHDGRPVAALMQFVGFEGEDEVAPPWAISDFPADLSRSGLRSSGMFGDGWLANVASLQLTQPDGPASVLIRGMVPTVGDQGFTTELRVLVDGQEVARTSLGLGHFELRAPAPAGAGRRHVDLRFSSVQQLPAPDTRRVGARAHFVGFEADAASPQPR
jgi:hypothetical protein